MTGDLTRHWPSASDGGGTPTAAPQQEDLAQLQVNVGALPLLDAAIVRVQPSPVATVPAEFNVTPAGKVSAAGEAEVIWREVTVKVTP